MEEIKMGFVNRMLEEAERREYVLEDPREGIKAKIAGGTIDDENDIRLFNYANGPKGKREPSDVYSFLFDYKGKILFVHLMKRLQGNEIHWSFAGNKDLLSEEELDSLREAMKVYAYEGFSLYEWNRLQKKLIDVTFNDKCEVSKATCGLIPAFINDVYLCNI